MISMFKCLKLSVYGFSIISKNALDKSEFDKKYAKSTEGVKRTPRC